MSLAGNAELATPAGYSDGRLRSSTNPHGTLRAFHLAAARSSHHRCRVILALFLFSPEARRGELFWGITSRT